MAARDWGRGGWDSRLFEACLSRSQQLAQPREGFSHRHPDADEIRKLVSDPVVYRFQYIDGTRATMLLMNGLVRDFTFAARLKGSDEPVSTLFHLPPTPNVSYSGELMSRVEEMFTSGKPTTPVERTLLTSGILAAAMQSLHQESGVMETPHLAVRYQVGRESLFADA
jgi:hypothetical protein